MKITSLRTPCVLIDQRRLERNINRMQQAAEAGGKRLRPHAKTHKSPDLALTQMARGAVGICCAKLGEAEVFAERGIPDIRLPASCAPPGSTCPPASPSSAAQPACRGSTCSSTTPAS